MANEVEMTAQFPLAGVDVSCEFERQPPLTSADGENCRAYDTIQERGRGGSRSGLSKLVNELVNGASVIQHLTVLVDPTLPGLNADSDDPDAGFPDPSTNNLRTRNFGRRLRPGGSGRQPNRNGPVGASTSGITFRQRAPIAGGAGGDTGTDDFSGEFPETPLAGDFIVLFAYTATVRFVVGVPPDPTIEAEVVNGSGAAYTHRGLYGRATYDPADAGNSTATAVAVSVWTLKASGSVLDKTFTVSRTGPCAASAFGVVYRGVHPTDPVGAAVTTAEAASGPTAPLTELETGVIPSPGAGSALVGFMVVAAGGQVMELTSDFTSLDFSPIPPFMTDGVCHKLDQASGANCTAVIDAFFTTLAYAAAGIGLRKKP